MSVPKAIIEAAKASAADMPITYDKARRMRYHPHFHENQNKEWTTTDVKYLIENYELFGPEHVSLHLKRTENSVTRYACHLRKTGAMPKPTKIIPNEKIYSPRKPMAGLPQPRV